MRYLEYLSAYLPDMQLFAYLPPLPVAPSWHDKSTFRRPSDRDCQIRLDENEMWLNYTFCL